MKLTLAVTLAGLQGLGTTEDGRERPVDRLNALARSVGPVGRRTQDQCERGDRAAMESFLCALGGDLIAFKFGNQAASRSEAELRLAIALRWGQWGLKLKQRESERIAGCAMNEWAVDFCPRCKNAKEVPNFQDVDGRQPMMLCPECSGTGVRRYTDEERTASMGECFAKAMDHAHILIRWAESLTIRLVKERLERL